MVLLEVVLSEGDPAYMRLALVCKAFERLTTSHYFREKAHFAWLDGN